MNHTINPDGKLKSFMIKPKPNKELKWVVKIQLGFQNSKNGNNVNEKLKE